jgi:hypothetical protein
MDGSNKELRIVATCPEICSASAKVKLEASYLDKTPTTPVELESTVTDG